MRAFAETCDSIAATSGKTEKVARLASYLRGLDDADLLAAARFFTGNPFARREQKTLSLGGSAVVAAAKNAWGVDDAALSRAYRATGDLGDALSTFVRPAADLGLFSGALTPASLAALFEEIAAAAGRSAAKRRIYLCERMLAACATPLEAKYAIKIVTGDLRIGLKEGLVAEAIAVAFDAEPDAVRKATMAAGDIGSVAIAARHRTLDGIAIAYGAPLGFMLASPMAYAGPYRDLRDGAWLVEEKFDGIRAQAHVDGSEVRLFSRNLNEITHTYPEVREALAALGIRAILDGELIAHRDGRVLPFRYLQTRLQRKETADALLDEIPVSYACFDILADGDAFLLDEPLHVRRDRLERAIATGPRIIVAEQQALAPDSGDEDVRALFEGARERGHEGLMLKRADSPYHPGRRGKWWLKLKRETSTLDVVVIAVEWGHGKRAKVLSDYTFAVRGRDGRPVAIGKAYSGLTDAEIATLTPWFLAHERGRRGRAIAVEPEIVLEVAFDVIQPSTLHESGFSLRFPRIARIRDDKPASEIDTIERVEEIYAEILRREGLA